jgi:hypothetical protein
LVLDCHGQIRKATVSPKRPGLKPADATAAAENFRTGTARNQSRGAEIVLRSRSVRGTPCRSDAGRPMCRRPFPGEPIAADFQGMSNDG